MRAPRSAFLSTSFCEYKRMGVLRESSREIATQNLLSCKDRARPLTRLVEDRIHDRRWHSSRFRCGCCTRMSSKPGAPRKARRSQPGWASKTSRPRSIACCWCRTPRAPSCLAVGRLGQASGRRVRSGTRPVLPSVWPPRRYRLAQAWSASDATQIALGFAYGRTASNAIAPGKTERLATLEAPANADHRFVALASEALTMARDWINTPAIGPGTRTTRGRRARHRRVAIGATYREWVGEELRSGNFPAIHAVGRASADDAAARRYPLVAAAADALPRLTLVGKGVCFDSGGLDIKPSAGMALMKKDMGGAAVALALAHMLMSVRHPRRAARTDPRRWRTPSAATPIARATCSRPARASAWRSATPMRKAAWCCAMRSRLADAERPDLIIDFATLTGAARVALGPELPALFGTDEALVAELARVARRRARSAVAHAAVDGLRR